MPQTRKESQSVLLVVFSVLIIIMILNLFNI